MKKAIWALVVIALGIAAYLLFFNQPAQDVSEEPVVEACDSCACCNHACDSKSVAE